MTTHDNSNPPPKPVLPEDCSRCGRRVLRPVACWEMKGGESFAYCTHDCHEKGPLA